MSRLFRRTGQTGRRAARVTFTLLFAVATWPSKGVAAEIQRQVQIDAQRRNNPVMITKVTIGDINVQCGLLVGPNAVQPVTPFLAGDDWLQTMTIYLFDRTERTIVAGAVRIGFPDLGDGRTQPQPQYVISLGRVPAAAALGRDGKPRRQEGRNPLAFPPGQILAIHVGDYMDRIREVIVRGTSVPTISKVFISIGPFYFEDGMQWGAGCFRLPDPEHPGRFGCIPDDDFFPGDMNKNWPPADTSGGYH